MIKILNINSGDAHIIFELLRIYFPYYEENEFLIVSLEKINEQSLIQISFPEKTFTKKIKEKEKTKEFRIIIAKWIINNIDDSKKVESSWGILTGIRPIKFVQKLRKSFDDLVVKKKLVSEYYISEDLVDLLMEIAQQESILTKNINRNGYSLYINIPFCPSRCHYCSYPTIKSNNRESIRIYMNSMLKELKFILDKMEYSPDTIYIGGGTPTSIPIPELKKVLDMLKEYSVKQEFTLEAGRPDTLSKDMLELLSSYDITRLSINPQTMSDKTLRRMGRNHTSEDVKEVYKEARLLKEWQINMDLILGLPGENIYNLKYSLDEILKLNPENITIHTLSMKNGSKLFEKNLVPFKEVKDLENYSLNTLKENLYIPYYMYRQKRILGNGVNIGYAKKGFESLYNMIMMEEIQSIIGVGMSSTSKILDLNKNSINKFSNYRNLRDYTEKIDDIILKKNKILEALKNEMD